MPVVKALKQSGLVSSTTEAQRLIEQGGVKLNGERLTDRSRSIARGESVVVQVGKRRFTRIRIA
jgi:tyrosyl-tRNA synthetase